MNTQQAIDTAIQAAEKNISAESRASLQAWIKAASPEEYLAFTDALIIACREIDGGDAFRDPPEVTDANLDALQRNLKIGPYEEQQRVSSFRRWVFPAAAAIIICLVAVYIWHSREQAGQQLTDPQLGAQPSTQQAPASQLPTLTLGDRVTTFTLEGPELQTLADTGFVYIDLTNPSVLRKYQTPVVALKEIQGSGISGYVSLHAGSGERYAVRLPDSSRLWMNAGARIRLPVPFPYNRNVTLSGEAFFEVVKNETSPFTVEAAETKITVTGTRFNVKGYPEGAETKITLLRGSVEVSSFSYNNILAPGEQAVIGKTHSFTRDEDTSYVTAWKNGLFHFKGENFYQIMPELERWYGIKVVYDGPVPPDSYTLLASRRLSLQHLLLLLTRGGIKNELRDNILTIKR